jgi:3-oxoacyl-[acyl-carrier-protein] synthase-1
MSAWILASSVVSPLGMTGEENYAKVRQQISGVATHSNKFYSDHPVHVGYIDDLGGGAEGTRFEKICRRATDEALSNINFEKDKTLYILSTTKGNIELLNNEKGTSVLSLPITAKRLAAEVGVNDSLVISNACISGVLALIIGKRFFEAKK